MRLDDHVHRQRPRPLIGIRAVPAEKGGIGEGAGRGPRRIAQTIDSIGDDVCDLTTNDRVIEQLIERCETRDVAAASHLGPAKGKLTDVLHALRRHHEMNGAALGILTQITTHQTPP